MSTPDLAPRRLLGGIIAVWVAAAVIAVAIGVAVPAVDRTMWLGVGLGVCLILSFGLQLATGRSHGFTQRVAAGVLGAMVTMGFVSLGFALAAVVPG
ncbi:hypothetical protein P0L94_01520 [Microbacter sp. GSS18]|nr:hypothetical protein P0L94_01520 [Microbacter sp. GSS18]